MRITRGWTQSGWPGGSGSGSVTSSIAAASRPLSRAASSAAWSSWRPRPAWSRRAPSGRRAKRRASRRPGRLGRQRQQADEDVGAGEEGVEVGEAVDARDRLRAAAPAGEREAEGRERRERRLAEGAEAHDAHPSLGRGPVGGGLPAAGALVVEVEREVAVQGEDAEGHVFAHLLGEAGSSMRTTPTPGGRPARSNWSTPAPTEKISRRFG